MRRVQKGLRRDATDVQAGAAKFAALLNADSFEAALASFDSGNVATWASADNSYIVFSGGKRPTGEGHQRAIEAELALELAETR